MLIKRCLRLTTVWWVMAGLIMGGMLPIPGWASPVDRPVLLVKIHDIDQLLQDLESLTSSGEGTAVTSQTGMIKGMLQGTDWIDPARSLVAGMTYDGQATAWQVFVPFRRPNANFQGAYGAIAGDNYYVMGFPPSPETTLSAAQCDFFVQEANRPLEAAITVEVAAHDMLRQAEPQIKAALQGMAANAGAGNSQAPFTPEDMQRTVHDFMKTLEQVQTLRVGLDADPEALQLLLDVKGLPESYLAGLLTDQKRDGRLAGYQPNYPMQFRSRAYNVPGVLQMLGASFGQMYSKMGFDFDELAGIAKGVTGEMAGGMAFDQNGMTFEMMYALHDAVNGEEYLANVYLPWFENYNRRMAALWEGQTGHPIDALYERTPDSRVAGHKVIGVRTRFPAMRPAGSQMPLNAGLQDYQTRMTAVKGLILVASSDAAIARMIAQAEGLQATPAQGPLATFSMDLGAYLRGIQALMPDSGPALNIPADIGHLTVQADMQGGELTTRTRVNVRDVQQVAELFTRLSAAGTAPQGVAPSATADATAETVAVPEETTAPAPDVRDTPAYWMDRGGLLSAYGNYKGAVRCYQKALALAPGLSEAHFQKGVAYGELGRFDAAIDAISRAIERMPTNGAYFYGRARVYLLAGDEELAMKDFMEAGFLGNEDARAYLKRAGVDWE